MAIESEMPLTVGEDNVAMQEYLEPTPPAKTPKAKASLAKKEVKRKTKNRIVSTSEKSKPKQIISWEALKNSFRQGQKHECAQTEIALNQCR